MNSRAIGWTTWISLSLLSLAAVALGQTGQLPGMVDPPAAPGALNGPIRSIEFGYAGFYRPGCITPITADIHNDTDEPFSELWAIQNDDDGERLIWKTDAPIAPGQTVRWTVLCCPQGGAAESGLISVAMIDSRGRAIQTVDARRARQEPMAMTPGSRVVGVLGQSLGGFVQLRSAGRSSYAGERHTVEPVHVVSLSPERMPSSWYGLDSIDVIFWDDPSPEALTAQQREALAQWVYRGGQLVIALGAHATEWTNQFDRTSRGDSTPLLPVQVLGTGLVSQNQRDLGLALIGPTALNAHRDVLLTPAPIAEVRVRDAAEVLAVDERGRPLLVHWPRGAGGVKVMTASMAELRLDRLNWPVRRALANLANAGYRDDQPILGYQQGINLTADMGRYLDSTSVGGTLVGLVVLLSLAYAALVGPGLWLLLRLRNKAEWNWWAFGLAVLAATAGSFLLTRINVRGPSVNHVAVMDLRAGGAWANVRGFVGLYSPRHGEVEIVLRDDPTGRLTPLIKPASEFSQYPDVRTYELDCADLTTLEVPIRRTIKQLAFDWQGVVEHTVDGELRYAGPHMLTGWVHNRLPVDLSEAVLVYVGDAGNRDPWVYPLGDIPAGASAVAIDMPADPNLKDHRVDISTYLTQLAGTSNMMGLDQIDPRSDLRRFGPMVQVLTTMQHYPQPIGQSVPGQPRLLERDMLQHTDRSDLLVPGRGLLIGLARDYNPARIDFGPGRVRRQGQTVVRVWFDIQSAPPATQPSTAPASQE